MFNLPPVFKNFPEGSSGFSRGDSSSLNLSNNSASKISSSLMYQLNYRAKFDSATADVRRGKSRVRVSGLHYLKNLPSVLSRQRDGLRKEEDLSKRHSFPEAASVSLPTSTTTLEYLLYRRGSRIIDDETQRDSEETKTQINNQRGPRLKIKTPSASDASSLSSRESNDYITRQFFSVEPCLYTHQMLVRASQILEFLQENQLPRTRCTLTKETVKATEDDDIVVDYNDTQDQIKTFELMFAALKFQKLLHETLNQSDFFTEYSMFQKYSSLVYVILYDLQSRKFQKRTSFPDEEIQPLCNQIEEALIMKKTRLQSFIAKERIKHNAPSIEYLLPESVRNMEGVSSNIPIYMWINQLKTRIEDVMADLESEGFVQLTADTYIAQHTGKVFTTDTHCSDLLVFPSALGSYFKNTKWAKMGHLVQQDKTSCLAAESVKYLLGRDKDVIHVNVGTGITTVHLASLLCKKSPLSHIWGFGIGSSSKVKKTIKNVEFLGATKNTKFLIDDFLSVDPEEPKLKSVKVILITANCSKSAIINPIQFLISEGEDMRFLGELLKAEGGADNVSEYVKEHDRILRHALAFPRVQAVVYTTRSHFEAENESVVTSALEYTHATSICKGVPFRVTPPVLPFTSNEIDSGGSGIYDRYVKFLPSAKSNGCFVVIISREPENPKEAGRSSIPIPRLKGLISKTMSAFLASEAGYLDVRDSSTSGKGFRGGKSGKRKLKGAVSTPEVKGGIISKLAGHKSPVAIGARMYQVDLVHKMEQRARQKSQKLDLAKVNKLPMLMSGLPGNDIFRTEWEFV